MSDTTADVAPAEGTDADGQQQEERQETFDREYVEKLRAENANQRRKTREAEQKAQELEALKLKDATAEERMKAAEARAAEAEARVLRRDIAIDARLSKDDAKFLDGLTDEDQMRALAKRLAASGQPKNAKERPQSSQVGTKFTPNGDRSATGGDDRDIVAKQLFGF